MRNLKKTLSTVGTFIVAGVLSIQISGCSKTSPIGAENSSAIGHASKNVRFFKAQTFTLKKIFDVSQLITAANGGTIQVGDDTTGISMITFDPNDLASDTTIDFWWDSQNFHAEFDPHGLTFNDSVYIRLSYKDADLGSTPETDLKIWYYNDVTELWEVVGDQVNTTDKYVEGWTTHFSRYAIGSE